MIDINNLNKKFEETGSIEVLNYFLNSFHPRIALASSLSIEDQAITDMLIKINPDAKIFTLDTGRLPYETYNLIDKTNFRYGIKINVHFPDKNEVEKLVNTKGVNSFYESIEARKECCRIRKIEPLKQALKNYDVWITGLRREQSITRKETSLIELDSNGKVKLNPLINWSEEEVWQYIKKFNVPYNLLYNKGYKSIGCAPCTRTVGEHEDIRNGRWWWENPEHKECGLHINEGITNG